jgi:GT2 family glycosyltransferase
MIRFLRPIAEFLAALLIAPVLLLLAAVALLGADITSKRSSRTRQPNRAPDTRSATVVIPNWNGRDLLERYLPSVVAAMAGHPANEILVVDNGSSDGSADYVREHFPAVTLLALPENRGFGGGSNAGFRAAKNDIVVLLNSDMRVDAHFLDPLLAGFTDADVFAVSCQIYLSDPSRRREETGLTEGWWEDGRLRVSHRDDPAVTEPFPCLYAGGGSSAFDRAKFLELGGFDELLAPFYLEDTDLGFLAWKRGWKVLYQPASVVYHEHRGTIGRKFTSRYIDSILKKNYLLFTWKNIHSWKSLASSLISSWAGALAASLAGDRPLRPNFAGIWRAFRQLPQAARSRSSARSLSVITDAEAFARSRGSHFRDRFHPAASPDQKLRVLFVSPYPILPPVHGGAVFMLQTLRELSKWCEVHALVLLDEPSQAAANGELAQICASVELLVRPKNASLASIDPHAVEEFRSRDVQWAIDRLIFLHRIDVLQVEYTAMGQYIEKYARIVTALFEHDVYFQSILRTARFFESRTARFKAHFEYLRALRYELNLLARCDQVQVCTAQNRDYLLTFRPELAPRIHAGLRAAIDTGAYAFPGGPREPGSLLFIGSARHKPNLFAIEWFAAAVFPAIVAARPSVRLYLAGFDAAAHPVLAAHPQIEMLGYVDDVRPWLSRCSLFVCPILSGSGVRVKLLEAFASGIPVLSTRIGAEGLAAEDGRFCALADSPGEFAQKAIGLLNADPSMEMTSRARAEVEANWDSAVVTARLADSYRALVAAKSNSGLPPSDTSRS